MELVCERSFRALVALRGQELRLRGDKHKERTMPMLAQSADRSPNSPSLIRFPLAATDRSGEDSSTMTNQLQGGQAY